jgi:hypothetical protein
VEGFSNPEHKKYMTILEQHKNKQPCKDGLIKTAYILINIYANVKKTVRRIWTLEKMIRRYTCADLQIVEITLLSTVQYIYQSAFFKCTVNNMSMAD